MWGSKKLLAPPPRRSSAHDHSSNQIVVPRVSCRTRAAAAASMATRAMRASVAGPNRSMARTPHDHSYSPGTVHRRRWPVLLVVLAMLAAAAPAHAGTYDVVSCGAPGANGVNRAWQVARRSTTASSTSRPPARSSRRGRSGAPASTAPNFTGAGFQLNAPAGAILDRMVIWRTGYRFDNTGSGQGPWVVQGYKADASVIGGPLTGETCVIPPGTGVCRFGAEGAMAPGARVERDLETTRVLYSVACFDAPGCSTANAVGLPVRGAEHLGLGRDRARRRAALGDRARPARGARLAHRRPAAALRRHRPRRHPPAAGAGRRARGPGDPAAVRLHRDGPVRRRWRSARPRSAASCPTAATRSASRRPTPPATSRASTAPWPSTATPPGSPSSPTRAAAGSPSTPSDPGAGVTGGTIEARRARAAQLPPAAHQPAGQPARRAAARAGRARPRRCA